MRWPIGTRRAGVPVLRRRASLCAALVTIAAVALAACGDAGTGPVPAPSALVQVSSETDSLFVGEEADPPLGVRVEGSGGEPVEGVPVRFSLIDGPGTVFPNLAVSNSEGVAEATFQGGPRFGTSRIRADVPSASNVSPLEFRRFTLPSREVDLEVVEGDGQRAEAGSQLARPFVVKVTAPSGVPAGGVEIVWEFRDGRSTAPRLASDTSFTDDEGITENLLTLGAEPAPHEVRAFATGGVATDTVLFRATGVEAVSGPVRLEAVEPNPLRAGEEATLRGSGFGELPENIEVRVEGTEAEILEARGSEIRIRVPTFEGRCRPARNVGVRALVNDEPGNGLMAALEPTSAYLDLRVGETRILNGPGAVDCLQLPAAQEGRSYRITAGNATRTAGGTTPTRFMVRAGAGLDQIEAAAEIAAGRLETGTEIAASRTRLSSSAPATDLEDPGAETALRGSARRELLRRRIGSGGGRAPDVNLSETARAEAASVAPGDRRTFAFSVRPNMTATCADTVRAIGGVVRGVGQHVLLVEDTLSPSDGFTSAQWRQLRDELDEVTLPTGTEYFGSPSDIDGNDRVVVLVTPEVNRLSPPGASARLGGFFLPLDLADSGDPERGGLEGPGGETCPTSNEGEVLYLAAADPGGEFGDRLPTSRALRNARSTTAHELQHLISAEQRVIRGTGGLEDLEEVWLGEGMSHIAEEIVGLRLMRRSLTENISFDVILGDREAMDLFNAFHGGNFSRLDLFMRQPSAAPVLSAVDPGGARSLQMRGFAWAFLRWVANQEAVGDESSLFRRLSSGASAHLSGIENLERAVASGWEQMVAEFSVALAVDDLGISGLGERYDVTTWDLRSIFSGLHENRSTSRSFPAPYPLSSTRLPFDSRTVDFDATASSRAHFLLESASAAPALALRLASQSGGGLDPRSAPQITIVRTR